MTLFDAVDVLANVAVRQRSRSRAARLKVKRCRDTGEVLPSASEEHRCEVELVWTGERSEAGRGRCAGAGSSVMTMLPVGLIVLIILVVLCAALGAVYAYIYFTRINPRSHRAACHRALGAGGGSGVGGLRKFVEPTTADDDAGGNATLPSASTHVFLFRKS